MRIFILFLGLLAGPAWAAGETEAGLPCIRPALVQDNLNGDTTAPIGGPRPPPDAVVFDQSTDPNLREDVQKKLIAICMSQ